MNETRTTHICFIINARLIRIAGRGILPVVIAGILASSAAAVQIPPASVDPVGNLTALEQAANQTLSVTRSSIQSVTVTETPAGEVRATLAVEGLPMTLSLRKHSIRSPDFQVLIQVDEFGSLVEAPSPPVVTYRGTVLERPEVRVRATVVDGEITALLFAPESVYAVEPLSRLKLVPKGTLHVVHDSRDWVNQKGFACGTGEGAEPLMPLAPLNAGQDFGAAGGPWKSGGNATEQSEGGVAGTGLKVTDIGLDADFEYYQLNGGNVINTVFDMETVMNNVAEIYETPMTAITYEITTVIVRTIPGNPYPPNITEPSALLNTFRDHWLQAPQSFIRRDTAHLFTGKDMDGSVIGIAWVGAICTNLGYGVSQSRYGGGTDARAALTAHELGHNWNAPHCNGCTTCAPGCEPPPPCCRIMCSGIGGCSGILTSFGCQENCTIFAYRNTRACLSDLSPPLTIPFFDDFSVPTFDLSKWSYVNGAVTSLASVNPPGSPRVAELDAAGIEQYRDDEMRTNFIQLAGESIVRASYYTQHRGVESNEQLIVDYFNWDRLWTQLNVVNSDGIDQADFTFHVNSLPADAYHDEFRLRFRTQVNETNDDWFLANVRVGNDCESDADCNDFQFCNGVETCVGDFCMAGVDPCQGTGMFCNEQLNQCVECLNNGHCSDTLFCNGVEVCAPGGTCQPGTYPCTNPLAPGCSEITDQCTGCQNDSDCDMDDLFCTVRHCIDESCVDAPDPCYPLACWDDAELCLAPGDVVCAPSQTTAIPGSEVQIDLFASDIFNLRQYQTTLSTSLTSGIGSLTIGCPGGVLILPARPDFVFAGQPNLALTDCPTRRLQSGLTNANGAVFLDSNPYYMGSYRLTVSPDAVPGSTFDIQLDVNPATYLRDPHFNDLTVTMGSPCATLTIVDVQCEDPMVESAGSRAVSVTPSAFTGITPVALRVSSPVWSCGTQYVQVDGSLGAVPVFQTAADWGTIAVTGGAVVPSTLYEITAECGATDSNSASASTYPWGDGDGNGIVDLTDISCVLDGFAGIYGTCVESSVDLMPCDPNGTLDVDDISAVLDAFGGAPYPCSLLCP